MRKDMHKVITERPRRGVHGAKDKFTKANQPRECDTGAINHLKLVFVMPLARGFSVLLVRIGLNIRQHAGSISNAPIKLVGSSLARGIFWGIYNAR